MQIDGAFEERPTSSRLAAPAYRDRTLSMVKAIGYATSHSFGRHRLFEFEREEPAPFEGDIKVL